MLLAVDIGNSNIVLGLFKDNKLIGKYRILSNTKARVKFSKGVSEAVIGSVVPSLTADIAGKIRKLYKIEPIIVGWKDAGLKIALKNKDKIGVDRLINAAAVIKEYGCPAIVIDLGTATTFCVINKKGTYIGGVITSGLAISRDVLHERTAKLPLIEIQKPKHAIGTDTVSAMKSGLYFGYVDMIEGMIDRIKHEMGGRAKVIATGGLSKLIASGTDKIDIVDPNLTLKGLKIIYDARSRGARRRK
jgi:type III pantothenate kinase